MSWFVLVFFLFNTKHQEALNIDKFVFRYSRINFVNMYKDIF